MSKARVRIPLLLIASAILCLGLANVASAQHPPPAQPPGQGQPHGTPPAEAHGGGDHGHGDHSHGGHHKAKVIDNWFHVTGFGPDKPIKNGPLFFALLNFVLLCYLLLRFTKKPISEYLANRHDTIKRDLEQAATLRQQAREKLAQVGTRLGKIDDEIAEIKAGVAQDAEREKERIIAKANDEAARIIKQAESTMEREIRRARRRLEAGAVEAALGTAEKLLKENLNAADRKRINDAYVAQIGDSTSPGGAN